MKRMTCCFTGHREIPEEEVEPLTGRLEIELRRLIDRGCCRFAAGGAVGFDTLAARTVLRLREDYPHIKLVLVLPCNDRVVPEDVLAGADEVICPDRPYFRGCMHQRDRRLVEESDVCLCYLTKPTGGTAYTVGYAKRREMKVINLGAG